MPAYLELLYSVVPPHLRNDDFRTFRNFYFRCKKSFTDCVIGATLSPLVAGMLFIRYSTRLSRNDLFFLLRDDMCIGISSVSYTLTKISLMNLCIELLYRLSSCHHLNLLKAIRSSYGRVHKRLNQDIFSVGGGFRHKINLYLLLLWMLHLWALSLSVSPLEKLNPYIFRAPY